MQVIQKFDYFFRTVLLKSTDILVGDKEGPKIVHTSGPGFHLLVLANEDVGREIVVLRSYERRESEFLSSLVHPEDICMDIGANTGYYTMLMASRATKGEVHSFEPVPLVWHLLNCGILLNGFKHVCANNFAIASSDGKTSFSQATDSAYSSLIPVGRKAEENQITISVYALDSYMAHRQLERVDILKVDVEGAEGKVLQGGAATFGSARKRPRIAMLEVYNPNLKPYGSSVNEIVSMMEGFGYKPFFVSPQGQPLPFKKEHHDRYYNVFFVTDESAFEK